MSEKIEAAQYYLTKTYFPKMELGPGGTIWTVATGDKPAVKVATLNLRDFTLTEAFAFGSAFIAAGDALATVTPPAALRGEKPLTEYERKVAQMKEALRLIELIGYREGEDFGWVNAHMRGVATAALSGDSIDHYWRLFPNHRHPPADTGEGRT